ncbi:prepilin-type N-terminal cleavage/methylation domain-containing protein [Eggerthella sp. YY7918]|uniref:prepilin-type N-terminal cleavage/methylation domain-containing protein n=1 Tax=Eggerthella sp. (strain YY7918) TaxID=502558 RepID=UPI0002171029|nr:prepilin-type N-terminal cleavage/methylation domain-containing protein [Eggerthella sp. YY7918]BAK43382.1 hypothetical protein EGYY_01200 [Eggerthella sp. YY7918]
MKEMIKRIREERGGFTLAELLIVVAIVLVLVAIAVPVYTGAMDNANKAVGQSAARAVKGEAVAAYALGNDKTATTFTATVKKNGDVIDLKPGDGGTPVNDLNDEQAIDLGQKISSTDAGVAVTVTLTPQDLTPTPDNTGGTGGSN